MPFQNIPADAPSETSPANPDFLYAPFSESSQDFTHLLLSSRSPQSSQPLSLIFPPSFPGTPDIPPFSFFQLAPPRAVAHPTRPLPAPHLYQNPPPKPQKIDTITLGTASHNCHPSGAPTSGFSSARPTGSHRREAEMSAPDPEAGAPLPRRAGNPFGLRKRTEHQRS